MSRASKRSKELSEWKDRERDAYVIYHDFRPDQKDYADHLALSWKFADLHKVIEKTMRNCP